MADDMNKTSIPSEDMDDTTKDTHKTDTENQDLHPLGEKGGMAQQENTDTSTADLTDTESDEGGN